MRPNAIRWIKDPTGRFPERPYYRQEDLDGLSEEWIVSFLLEAYGKAEFPVSTEDLTVMIECDTFDLDQYADLSEEGEEGEEVQGLTLFYPDQKPVVKISQELADASHREHRLRTTLTHEFAHVKLHAKLWPFDQPRLFPDEEEAPGPRCKRPGDIGGSGSDWMEWQAGYVSGAILMPVTQLRRLVQMTFDAWGTFGSVSTASVKGVDLIARVAGQFEVSNDAARVRLAQLDYLTDRPEERSLELG
jgi:Zn-dependent peptidase ImmA (M78 family)